MKPYNPVDVCHYCNDRMYEYLKKKIHEKIEFYEFIIDRGTDVGYSPNHIRKTLKSLLEDDKK